MSRQFLLYNKAGYSYGVIGKLFVHSLEVVDLTRVGCFEVDTLTATRTDNPSGKLCSNVTFLVRLLDPSCKWQFFPTLKLSSPILAHLPLHATDSRGLLFIHLIAHCGWLACSCIGVWVLGSQGFGCSLPTSWNLEQHLADEGHKYLLNKCI